MDSDSLWKARDLKRIGTKGFRKQALSAVPQAENAVIEHLMVIVSGDFLEIDYENVNCRNGFGGHKGSANAKSTRR
jgi:hypothetical protein